MASVATSPRRCRGCLMLPSLLRRLLRRPHRPSGAGQDIPGVKDCIRALKAGKLDEAVRCFRDYLAQNPDDAAAYNNLGVALQRQGRPTDALACYEAAVRIAPAGADGWYNAAVIHHLGRNFAEAQRCYRAALEADPTHAEAHREYSMLRLARGEFAPEVWASFRHRRRCDGFEPSSTRCSAPDWDGESLDSKRVLVFGEQGLGDEILYASCYSDLIARAEGCVIETESRLERLFQRSFNSATVWGRERTTELDPLYAGIAYRVASGDLPLYFRPTPQAFPVRRAYLRADAGAVERWKSRLSALGTGLKVGISWQGGTPRTNRSGRSIGVDEWRPVLRIPGVHFVSLQYGDCREDLAHVRDGIGIPLHHWAEAIDTDYDETAGLVCALDLVITVTTSVAHLAGALGQTAWIVTNIAPRWCYLSAGSTTPWYPSARIFRQTRPGAWDDVMQQVAEQLAEKVTGRRGDAR